MTNNKLPIGTQKQYDHVVELYNALLAEGISPEAAVNLVSQKVQEKGWTGYVTGDNQKYATARQWAKHIKDWHGRMYPGSLTAKNYDDFNVGINGTREQHARARRTKGKDNSGRYYYNTYVDWDTYKKAVYNTRIGVLKRLNYYRSTKGQPPLSYQQPDQQMDVQNPEYSFPEYNPYEAQMLKAGGFIRKFQNAGRITIPSFYEIDIKEPIQNPIFVNK